MTRPGLAAMGALCLVTGCASTPPPISAAPPPVTLSTIEPVLPVLEDYPRIRALTPGALEAELAALDRPTVDTPADQLRRSLLTGLREHPVTMETTAACDAPGASAPTRGLCRLLDDWSATQRQARNLDAANRERDLARQAAQRDGQRAETLQQRNQVLEAKLSALRKQLDELGRIERDLQSRSARDPAPAVRP